MRFGRTGNNKLSKLLKSCAAALTLSVCITSVACQNADEKFDARLKRCVELGHNDVNGGIECLEKLLESNPDRAVIYSFLADDYRESGQIGKAEKAIEIFVRSYPNDAAGRESFCRILMEKGDLHDALAECSRAVHIEPKASSPRITAAKVQEKMGDLRAAELSYKNALEINPDDRDVLLYLGSFYERTGQLDEAIRTLERLVELKPENYKKIEEGIKKLKEKRELRQNKEQNKEKKNPNQ